MSFFSFTLYLSLAICIAGLMYRFQNWFRTGENAGGSQTSEGMAGNVFSVRMIRLVHAVFFETLLQVHLLKKSFLRWFMHISIFYGFTLLILMHAMDDIVMTRLWTGYESTLNPYMFLRNFFGMMVISGVAIAAYRRITVKKLRQLTRHSDWTAILMILAIIFSGFLLESVQILSPTLFNQMARDYLGDDDEETLAPLRVYWAKHFNVVFPVIPDMNDLNISEQGRMIHEENCAFCHSRPDSAFVSYSLARTIQPLARMLDSLHAQEVLYYIHFLICFAGLAYLPFGKFFHWISAPANLLVRGDAHRYPAVPDTPVQRAIGMDACTRCGICSIHCSVEPLYRMMGNKNILPSEKLESLKRLVSGQIREKPDLDSFSQGSFICTGCGRCTVLCPSKINLQDIWTASKKDLVQKGFSEPHTWIHARRASEWAVFLKETGNKKCEPSRHVNLTDHPDTFKACIQCTTCTSVCPVVAASDDPESDLDFTPQQIMNLMRLQLKDLALGARMVWDCTTCYMCQEHCPQGVRVADVLYELRNIATARLKDADLHCSGQCTSGFRLSGQAGSPLCNTGAVGTGHTSSEKKKDAAS
jgi:heterodisulfide reductase subunit C